MATLKQVLNSKLMDLESETRTVDQHQCFIFDLGTTPRQF